MKSTKKDRLLIIGNPQEFHVGAHFLRAARASGIETQLVDVRTAYNAMRVVQIINWRFRGRRPTNLNRFGESVVQQCEKYRPKWLLTTGLAPLTDSVLQSIGQMGIHRLNFLTDDPWNSVNYAPWFLSALPHYDIVFSPRHANFNDLHDLGCSTVSYLPFAYDPDMHKPTQLTSADYEKISSDILFAGGADRDRMLIMTSLIKREYKLALYGGYWHKYRTTRSYARGHADLQLLRKAVGAAKVNLCLVRRSNRDGHAMRTFEVPAMRGCMLMEDTVDHQQFLGPDGECVMYFQSNIDMLEKLDWLLAHDSVRIRLAEAAYERITHGNHTYGDRLQTMLQVVE